MRSTSCSWWWTTRNRWNKQQKKGEKNEKYNLKENINSERDRESVKPLQWDHSKRLHWHKTFNSSNVFSMFSKEQRFHSNQTIHIKHPGIKFQIFELCFPSHWCQQDNNPATNLGITQWIPKAWSMKVHKVCVTWKMKQKMVYRLPITTTHTTLIYQRAIPKHEIIQRENPIVSCYSQEESHSLRNIWFLNTLPRKQKIQSTLNCLVIRSSAKLTITFEPPTKSIPPITPRNTRLDKLK